MQAARHDDDDDDEFDDDEILYINRNLKDTTITVESGTRSNGNKGVLHSPQ